MDKKSNASVNKVVQIDEAQIHHHLDRVVRGTEHLDGHGIVHMNGRIYDPHLGRFLQADPFVEDSTTLNRYTYVHNNPLAYTDPSGYLSTSDFLKIVAVAVYKFSNYPTLATPFTLFPYAGVYFRPVVDTARAGVLNLSASIWNHPTGNPRRGFPRTREGSEGFQWAKEEECPCRRRNR